MKHNATSIEKFDGWFVMPIRKLKELPEGDGAFAAMMIALPLYERYITSKLSLEGRPTGDEHKRGEIGVDLGLDERQRSIFWDMFRNGFAHQAMVKDGKTKWMVSHTFGELPEFKTLNGQNYVCLDPWKFAERVLNKFKSEPRLITASASFPFAEVFSL